MGLLGDNKNELFYQSQELGPMLKQWMILIICVMWMIRCTIGILHLTKNSYGMLEFDSGVLYVCMCKFILILMGSFVYGTVIEIYFIFLLQTYLNNLVAWMLHSRIIAFHKPHSKIKKAPTIVFSFIMLLVTYMSGRAFGGEQYAEFLLNCENKLYPRQWVYLYVVDISTGIISLIMMNWYTYFEDIGREEMIEEFQILKRMVGNKYKTFCLHDVDQQHEGAVAFINKFRAFTFRQCLQHSIATIIFGCVEISLALICVLVIENMDDPSKMVNCKDRFYWDQGAMMLGNIYMTLHSLMLTFSAVGLIFNFYLLPKKENLLIGFKICDTVDKVDYDDDVTALILESALPKKDEDNDAEDLDDKGDAINDDKLL